MMGGSLRTAPKIRRRRAAPAPVAPRRRPDGEPERRREPRYPGGFAATEIDGERRYFRMIVDFSRSGLCFVDAIGNKRPGDPVVLITTPPSSPTVRLIGQVVRVHEGRVGVRIQHARRERLDPFEAFLRGRS